MTDRNTMTALSGSPLTEDPTAGHPTPQLRRPCWHSLDGTWALAYDDAGTGLLDGWSRGLPTGVTRPVTVPYPPESARSGVGETGYHPVVWYERRLTLADLAAAGLTTQGDRLLLHCGAVDYRAEAWLAGQHLGSHEGGHVPFSLDLTPALLGWARALVAHGLLADPGRPLRASDLAGPHALPELAGLDEAHLPLLVLRAEDLPLDAGQPRGKQDWRRDPHVIWYSRTTGIWQHVWLEALPAVALTELAWTPARDGDAVTLTVLTSAPVPSGARLEVRLDRCGRHLVTSTTALPSCTEATVTLPLREQVHGQRYEELLWSPEHPRLIDAQVRLLPPLDPCLTDDESAPGPTVSDGPLDEVASYLGLRSVGTASGRFLLNDRPYYLRAVLEQGFWPDSHLAASDDELREEVALIKELGFNTARLHQKIEDPRFLYWADRLGLLVWGEVAAPYEFTTQSVTRLTTEWVAAVRRDRSHPCVVAWVPVNESWGVQHVGHRPEQQALTRALTDLTRALDPSRPVISNDGWEHTTSDLLTIHDYEPSRQVLAERYGSREAVDTMIAGYGPAGRRLVAEGHRADPDAPVILSEFGGIRFVPDAPDGEATWGYSTAVDAEDLAARLAAVLEPVHASPVLAGFCYTQLTDTMQEANGLTDERRRPKIPAERIRQIIEGTHPTR